MWFFVDHSKQQLPRTGGTAGIVSAFELPRCKWVTQHARGESQTREEGHTNNRLLAPGLRARCKNVRLPWSCREYLRYVHSHQYARLDCRINQKSLEPLPSFNCEDGGSIDRNGCTYNTGYRTGRCRQVYSWHTSATETFARLAGDITRPGPAVFISPSLHIVRGVQHMPALSRAPAVWKDACGNQPTEWLCRE